MNVDVVSLPSQLSSSQVMGRAVVVFDVLRATTTITAALAAGVGEIRVFGNLDAAREASHSHTGPRLLCGEHKCLPPDGFDLGNSPLAFNAERHTGRTMFLSTTNGTRAFMAARHAAELLAGAVVNAKAVAEALITLGRDVTLLCAGTDGQLADEDVLGAGAVAHRLSSLQNTSDFTTNARAAIDLFKKNQSTLLETMKNTQGGKNIRAVGLDDDITFAARIDALNVVGIVCEGSESSLTLRNFRTV